MAKKTAASGAPLPKSDKMVFVLTKMPERESVLNACVNAIAASAHDIVSYTDVTDALDEGGDGGFVYQVIIHVAALGVVRHVLEPIK